MHRKDRCSLAAGAAPGGTQGSPSSSTGVQYGGWWDLDSVGLCVKETGLRSAVASPASREASLTNEHIQKS